MAGWTSGGIGGTTGERVLIGRARGGRGEVGGSGARALCSVRREVCRERQRGGQSESKRERRGDGKSDDENWRVVRVSVVGSVAGRLLLDKIGLGRLRAGEASLCSGWVERSHVRSRKPRRSATK